MYIDLWLLLFLSILAGYGVARTMDPLWHRLERRQWQKLRERSLDLNRAFNDRYEGFFGRRPLREE